MLRCGAVIRFSAREVREFREIGLDMSTARNACDVERQLVRWTKILAAERPDLLEKIAVAMARAQGVRLPTKLSAVRAKDS